MSSSSAVTDRAPHRPSMHPRLPLSKETSRRLLSQLLQQAEAGDAASAESLIRLGRYLRRTGVHQE
jgi:hypothetical protein